MLIAAGADTGDCLNELLQIFWGAPGQIPIETVAGAVRARAAIPGGGSHEVASAVNDSIDARARARLALEEPELWQRYVVEMKMSSSADRNRAAQAQAWLLRRVPSGVEEEELQAGWGLVVERLRAQR